MFIESKFSAQPSLEFYMPTWPTLFPLYLHYKKDPPHPHGYADSLQHKRNMYDKFRDVPHFEKTRYLSFK